MGPAQEKPKTAVDAPDVREIPEADCAAGKSTENVPRAAPHDPPIVTVCREVFPLCVAHVVGVSEIRLVSLLSPEAARPFPDVAGPMSSQDPRDCGHAKKQPGVVVWPISSSALASSASHSSPQGYRRCACAFACSAHCCDAKPSARLVRIAPRAMSTPPRAAFSHSASDGSVSSQPAGRRARQCASSQRQNASASYQRIHATGRLSKSCNASGRCSA